MTIVDSAGAAVVPSHRSIRILALAVFLVAYGTNVSTPLLVTYRDRLDLGSSATMAIFTVYVMGIMGILPFGGQLSDRFGRRRITVPFIALSAVGSLVLILGRDTYGFLLLGRFLLGIVSGAVLSIGAAWLQELLGPGNEQRSAVLSTVLTFAGFGLGPPVSALISEIGSAPLVAPYVLHAVATAATIPLMWLIPETAGRSTESIRLRLGIPPEGQQDFRRVIVPAAVWVFGFPSTSFALFPVIISDAVDGNPVVVAAAAGTLTAWSGLIARPLLPRLGAGRALLAGMACGVVGYGFGAASFITDVWQLVLPAAFLLGGASGLLTAGALNHLGRIADSATRGSINSTFYLLAYPGMAMPILLTGVGSLVDLSVALIGVTLIATAAALVVFRRHGELLD